MSFAKNFSRNYEKKNNTWTLGWWVVRPSNPAIQHIILKIVEFYDFEKLNHGNLLISKLHSQAFLPAKRAATHRLTALVREKTREKPEISTPTLHRPTMDRITKFHPKKRLFFLLNQLRIIKIHKTFTQNTSFSTNSNSNSNPYLNLLRYWMCTSLNWNQIMTT